MIIYHYAFLLHSPNARNVFCTNNITIPDRTADGNKPKINYVTNQKDNVGKNTVKSNFFVDNKRSYKILSKIKYYLFNEQTKNLVIEKCADELFVVLIKINNITIYLACKYECGLLSRKQCVYGLYNTANSNLID